MIDTSGCQPTFNNLAFYLQGVSVQPSTNMTSEYFVTATLPSSKASRRVWQFESQGTLTGPVGPTNSIFLLDYTQAAQKCPQFNITFVGALNGTLIIHNQTFSANKYMSYRRLSLYVLELKFDRFPTRIVECYGASSTQPYFFSVYINDAATNILKQPNWMQTVVLPVLTTNQKVGAGAIPTQLSTYSPQQATEYGSGYYFLNGQTGTVADPFAGGGQFSTTFATYYQTPKASNETTRTLPNMEKCAPRIVDSSSQTNLDTVGIPVNVKTALTDFTSAHFEDLTDSLPQHTHQYDRQNFDCNPQVTDDQLGSGFLKSISVPDSFGEQIVHVNGVGGCVPGNSVASLLPTTPMKYNFATTGYTTSYFVVGNDVAYDIQQGTGSYMVSVCITPDFVFLSCANLDQYYTNAGVQNSKVNNTQIASIQYPVKSDGQFDTQAFDRLYPKTEDQWRLGGLSISLTLSHLLYHQHAFGVGNINQIGLGAPSPQQSSCTGAPSSQNQSTPYPTSPSTTTVLPLTNTMPLTLNSITASSSTAYFPVGTILSIKGSSKLIQPGADGKPPSTLFGGTLLLCDGHSIDPTTYPIVSSLLHNDTLPDFTTYGYSLYSVGGEDTSGNNFAARVNDPIFVPVEKNSLDRVNPLSGYNGNYTVYWVVQDMTAGAIGDKFGVSLETLTVMNPDIVSADQVIKACNNNLPSVIALPNVPSVLTQLYCRLPGHNHQFQGEPTGTPAQSAPGGRNRIQGFSFDNNISTAITNKPDPNQYDSFDGYASTVAVVYYMVGDLQTKFTCP